MKRALPLILILLSLILGCQRGQDVSFTEAHYQPNLLEASADRETQWQQYDHRQQQEAILSDASNSYRVCNTRPQRLLPSQGAKQERTSGKQPCILHYQKHQSLKRTYGRRERKETAPFCFVASRDYYIIALRRILR